MRDTLRFHTVSLMVSIVLWGTLLGGVAYSHLVYFPAYLASLPDSAVVVTGPYGLNERVFWGLIHPLLLLSLATTLWSNWNIAERRKLIGISIGVYVLVLTVTAIYFVPELGAFAESQKSAAVSPAEWAERAQRWQRLSWTRGTSLYLSITPLLLALVRTEGKG